MKFVPQNILSLMQSRKILLVYFDYYMKSQKREADKEIQKEYYTNYKDI